MASVTQGGINLLIWTAVFTVLDLLAIGLRFWAARIIRRQLYADDYLIVFSWVGPPANHLDRGHRALTRSLLAFR